MFGGQVLLVRPRNILTRRHTIYRLRTAANAEELLSILTSPPLPTGSLRHLDRPVFN